MNNTATEVVICPGVMQMRRSTKKKPIKQLYFEWEYAGIRGKTYVRTDKSALALSHLREEVIALNEAKVPVIEILELLTYNPNVARSLGIV